MLIVGSGVREHAIASRISNECRLFNYGICRNPGLNELSEDCVADSDMRKDRIVRYAVRRRIDLAIVETEHLLYEGLVDDFQAAGISTSSPCKKSAELERNKSLSRSLMRSLYPSNVCEFQILRKYSDFDRVLMKRDSEVFIKPLIDQKGKKRYFHTNDSKKAIAFVENHFATGNSPLMVDTWIDGREFYLYCFTDGKKSIFSYPILSYPFKDEGNRVKTGGMGSVSWGTMTLPFLTSEQCDRAREIMSHFLDEIKRKGMIFRGTICGQFFVSGNRILFNEFDVRAGDPEIVNVLGNLESSYLDLMIAISDENLVNYRQVLNPQPSVTVCLSSPHYPQDGPQMRFGVEEGMEEEDDVKLFFGSVKQQDGYYITTNSRAIGIYGEGNTINKAREKTLRSASKLSPPLYFRRDVGLF